MVRVKLFTLDLRLVRGLLGKLAAQDEAMVRKMMKKMLPGEEV